MITDEQLAALDQAERAATPGLWTHECIRESPQTKEFALRLLVIGKKRWRTEIPYTLIEHDADFNDAHFIALSRNSMRQLLDEVRLKRSNTLYLEFVEKVNGLEKDNAKLRAELVAVRIVLENCCKVVRDPQYGDDSDWVDGNITGLARQSIKRIDDTLGDG